MGPRGDHLVERTAPIAGLHVDRGDRVREHGGVESGGEGIEHRRLDAVVRCQPADEDVRDPGVAQQLGQLGAVEARVGVGVLRRRLLDERPGERGDLRVQLGAVRACNAVHGPDPALLGEGAVVGGMRVTRLDDEVGGARRAHERFHDGVAAGNAQRTARQEVVLDVDGDESGQWHRRISLLGSGAQPGPQRGQARRPDELVVIEGRCRAHALGGGVMAIVLERGRMRRARAVAHDLGQQGGSRDRFAGQVQDVGAVGTARHLVGAGLGLLARRELHRIPQRGVLLAVLFDELVDGADRLAGAQARADAEGVDGRATVDERPDPGGVEVAGEDDRAVVQAGVVEHAARRNRERVVIAGVDPDRLQRSARQSLRVDRAAYALDRVVGVDEQRRTAVARAQLVAEDAELAGAPARHDLRVRHRAGRGDRQVAGGSRRRGPCEAREVCGAGSGVARAEAVEAPHREVPDGAVARGPHDQRRVRGDAQRVVHRREHRRLDERRLQPTRGDPQQRGADGDDRALARRPDGAREAQVAQALEHGLVERDRILVGEPAQVGLTEAHPREEGERLMDSGNGHRADAAGGQLEGDEVVCRPLMDVVRCHREAVEIGGEGVVCGHVIGG
ncbi:MAG TPA: hypothetical protein VNA28_13730 [Solirubrobacteraceae bacterium]|nr:hypothetical protein [Solirubrobacteraceae bacterium]